MNCSYTSRCDNPKLIYFDDIYICDNCFSIFEKHHKELNKLLLNVAIIKILFIHIINLYVIIVTLCVLLI